MWRSYFVCVEEDRPFRSCKNKRRVFVRGGEKGGEGREEGGRTEN